MTNSRSFISQRNTHLISNYVVYVLFLLFNYGIKFLILFYLCDNDGALCNLTFVGRRIRCDLHFFFYKSTELKVTIEFIIFNSIFSDRVSLHTASLSLNS